MNRMVILIYGVVVYVLFLGTFLYAVGFVENLLVPKSIDSGTSAPLAAAIAINVVLLGLFGLQHSIMARPEFKKVWTRWVPVAAERSTFVLGANITLALLFWQWRPIPDVLWRVEMPWARVLLYAVSFAGVALVLYATFVIDHFDLFGLRQVWLHFRNLPYHHPPFVVRSLYHHLRHPIMLGFIIAFWFTPDMTVGHLLFAVVTTGYILVAIQLEERDLLRILGDDYRRYRAQTPILIPALTRAAEETR